MKTARASQFSFSRGTKSPRSMSRILRPEGASRAASVPPPAPVPMMAMSYWRSADMMNPPLQAGRRRSEPRRATLGGGARTGGSPVGRSAGWLGDVVSACAEALHGHQISRDSGTRALRLNRESVDPRQLGDGPRLGGGTVRGMEWV